VVKIVVAIVVVDNAVAVCKLVVTCRAVVVGAMVVVVVDCTPTGKKEGNPPPDWEEPVIEELRKTNEPIIEPKRTVTMTMIIIVVIVTWLVS
jgi:hypothetical protein